MLSVYGLTANGEVDAMATRAPVTLAWHLGSDGTGVDQACHRVRVTSLATGACVLDTGMVESAANHVTFETDDEVGTFVWFVEVGDERGESACSVPGAFGLAREGAVFVHPVCAGVLAATGEGEICADDPALSFLSCEPWARLTGLSLVAGDANALRCVVPDEGPERVRASLLAERGLIALEIVRDEARTTCTLLLAPGVTADVTLAGRTLGLPSGRHEIVS